MKRERIQKEERIDESDCVMIFLLGSETERRNEMLLKAAL